MAPELHSIHVPRPAAMLRRLGSGLLDAVLPPRCLACGTIVDGTAALCPPCWSRVHFVAEPLCAACGTPLEFDLGDGALCAGCVGLERPFARARAAIAYDDGSRGMILGFKHGDRTDAAPTFAVWMARAGARLLAECDLLAPVPLHWTRLFVRRYNQAALLAYAVGRIAGRPVRPDLLRRHKRTPMLTTLGPGARADTVRSAISLPARNRAAIVGRRVLLIDDVFTTGATVGACTRELLRRGAAGVDVLTLARVVRPVAPTLPRATTRAHDPAPISGKDDR